MLSMEQLTAFFGWCSVINMGLLIFSTVMLIVFKDPISSIHSRLMGIEKEKLPSLYMHYLAYYKIAIIMFNITPYIGLKMLA